MAVEIERKFLVHRDRLPPLPEGTVIKQGYLPSSNNTVTRVRLKGEKAFLTIKGESSADGTERLEFEYAIPTLDAQALIDNLCEGPQVDKTRYEIAQGSHTWELDIFAGDNHGLVVAEIELQARDEAFDRPDWLAEEVTGQAQYYNSSLIKRPFNQW